MLRINARRLLDDLEALGEIGRTPQGGVSRPAMSPADVEGRAWFRARVEAAGLEFRRDGAANLSAVLPAGDPTAPTLLTGSHLDTVPNGGRYDGALGVLAALEILRTLRQAGLSLPVHLEAISFTDEEGELQDQLGSRALAGTLTARDLDRPRGGGDKLAAGMRRLGVTHQGMLAARRDPQDLLAFVEQALTSAWSRPSWASAPIGCDSWDRPPTPARHPWTLAPTRYGGRPPLCEAPATWSWLASHPAS
jgi:N-carbamoyl-L-amino-acid hydrolase